LFTYIQKIHKRRSEEQGASAVEYGLLVAAIAAIIVLIVFAIGKFVNQGFTDTCTSLDTEIDAADASCGTPAVPPADPTTP